MLLIKYINRVLLIALNNIFSKYNGLYSFKCYLFLFNFISSRFYRSKLMDNAKNAEKTNFIHLLLTALIQIVRDLLRYFNKN